MSDPSLYDNLARGRYELIADDQVAAYADYTPKPDSVTFTHTQVLAGHEGKGYGSKLAQLALRDVRTQGKRVIARCDFIAGYLKKHPEDGTG
jgi:uncharacterized protein